MATTVQNIVDRAKALSSANGLSSLTSDTAEMIFRVNQAQNAIFDQISAANRSYFAATASITSTSGASGRSFDLSAVTPPVARVLRIVLTASGATLNQVDLLDTDGELAPRYYMLGTTAYEVSNDWNTASSAAVSATLTYVKRATQLSTSGALTQTVTLQDEFADLLDLKLGAYLAHKDVGRDPQEIARLEAMYDERFNDFLTYLDQFGGVEARRHDIPAPRGTKK